MLRDLEDLSIDKDILEEFFSEKESAEKELKFFHQYYIQTLKKNGKNLMNKEQEVALAKAIKEADDQKKIELRNKFSEHNFRLVIFIANKYKSSALSLEDLIQEGCIGLLKAIERFDYSKDCRFSVYAIYWIKQTIERAIIEQSSLIKLPVDISQELNKIHKAIENFLIQKHKEPTSKELSEITGLSVEKIQEVLKIKKQIVSLDKNFFEEGNATFHDIIPCQYSEKNFNEIENNDFSLKFWEKIEEQLLQPNIKIKSRQKEIRKKCLKVLILFFKEGKDFQEIAQILQIKRVRNYYERALRLLKNSNINNQINFKNGQI